MLMFLRVLSPTNFLNILKIRVEGPATLESDILCIYMIPASAIPSWLLVPSNDKQCRKDPLFDLRARKEFGKHHQDFRIRFVDIVEAGRVNKGHLLAI